jgi:hypothetical protein
MGVVLCDGRAGDEHYGVKPEEREVTVMNYDEENQKDAAADAQATAEARKAETNAEELTAEALQVVAKRPKADKNARRKADKKRKKAEEPRGPAEEAGNSQWVCLRCDEINVSGCGQCHNCGCAMRSFAIAPCDRARQAQRAPELLRGGTRKHDGRGEGFAGAPLSSCESRADHRDTDSEREARSGHAAVSSARRHKDSGNKAYKRGEYENAMDLYQEAWELLLDPPAMDSQLSSEALELGIAVLLNMALVVLKMAEEADDLTLVQLGHFVLGLVDGVLVLDPGNAKALFRRKQVLALISAVRGTSSPK